MKSLTSAVVAPIQKLNDSTFDNPQITKQIRQAVIAALESVEESRQLCLVAGQMLNEVQDRLEHGEFKKWIEKHLPQICYATAHIWARAASNIAKALPQPAIDVDSTVTVSAMLTMPDAELTTAQRKYKQEWFDFTNGKTIKECLDGVFVDGDAAHRVDRAVNGKTKGGVGKQPDRKAIEKFTATKLKHITTFLTVQKKSSATGKKQVTGWRKISPVQQTQISAVFCSFLETAPAWLLENLADKIKTEARLNDAQRIAR